MGGIVFVNPKAGADAGGPGALQEAFTGAEIVSCEPAEIADRVDEALIDRPAWIGVAGGDGTLRCAAERLLGGDVPLLAVPAGTRNHFARELGIADVEAAVVTAGDGRLRCVDVADVNGHCFINNSSIGLYPQVVVRRVAHQRRMPKRVAHLVATWEQIRHGHRFWVALDGVRARVWMVFVGNGPYGDGIFDLIDREALDRGCLDVRAVRADRPFARVRVVGALVLGRLNRSPLLLRWICESVTIDVDGGSVAVALDGEVEQLEPPLRYRTRPGALPVLVPGP